MRTDNRGPRSTLGVDGHEELSKYGWRNNLPGKVKRICKGTSNKVKIRVAQDQGVMGRVSQDEAGEVGKGEEGKAMQTMLEIWDIVQAQLKAMKRFKQGSDMIKFTS